jgi:hypothetical protein
MWWHMERIFLIVLRQLGMLDMVRSIAGHGKRMKGGYGLKVMSLKGEF